MGDLGVSQTIESTLVRIGHPAVVKSQCVKECSLEVMDRHRCVNGLVAELVGRAVDVPRLEPAAGQPE